MEILVILEFVTVKTVVSVAQHHLGKLVERVVHAQSSGVHIATANAQRCGGIVCQYTVRIVLVASGNILFTFNEVVHACIAVAGYNFEGSAVQSFQQSIGVAVLIRVAEDFVTSLDIAAVLSYAFFLRHKYKNYLAASPLVEGNK